MRCACSPFPFRFRCVRMQGGGVSKADLLHLPAGDFSYPEGSSGWTDTSIGSQGWDLFKNSTTKGTNAFSRYRLVSVPPRD